MARIRTIKPEFFRSRSLAKCDRDARLTFAGLWTEADDHGRGVADPRILKGALWALDDDVTHQHVSAHLDVLVATGHIKLYESAGETYFEISNWTEHQASAYRRGEAKHPEPETYLEGISHDGVQESAGRTDERAGREGKGEEGNREGKGDAAPDGDGDTPDPIEELFEEEFWQPYPRHATSDKLGGGGSRKKSLERFAKLSNRKRERCLIGVKHYAVFCKATDTFPKYAEKFIAEESWEDHQEPPNVRSIKPGHSPPSIEDQWQGVESGRAQL